MKLKVTAKVSGSVVIPTTTSIQRNNMLFDFVVNEKSLLTELSVSTSVPPEKLGLFVNSITPADGDTPTSFSVGGDKELYDLLIVELQLLESSLSFATLGSLKNIDWSNAKEEFIAETPEEVEQLKFTGFSRHLEHVIPTVTVSLNSINILVELLHEYKSLAIPKAFYREGLNYHRGFQYVNAFYHFYFVIEDFFSGGKTGMSSVMSEFSKSAEYIRIATEVLLQVSEDPRHRLNLERFFLEESCEITPQGLQKLLFHLRGNLHHYFSKSPKTRGTPFNQGEYETISLTTMITANLAIGYREADISQNLKTQQSKG